MAFKVVCGLMAGLVLASSDVRAQVYRCEQAGKVSYSSTACAYGSSKTVPMSADSGKSRIRMNVVTEHYSVDGTGYAAALASVRQRGPKGFAGWARWNVKYNYQTQNLNGQCKMSDVTIHVTGKILMPRWEQESAAQRVDRDQWRKMYARLKIHEDGHIQHGREFAVLLQGRLLGLGYMPCESLAAEAQKAFDQLMKNLKFRDAEYDRRTEHGLRQEYPF